MRYCRSLLRTKAAGWLTTRYKEGNHGADVGDEMHRVQIICGPLGGEEGEADANAPEGDAKCNTTDRYSNLVGGSCRFVRFSSTL